jgi:glucose/arabinose dehydrogenase
MRKSTLFISAVLTTFVMAMLAGVASAYQNVVQQNSQQQAAATQAQPEVQPQVKAISHAQAAEQTFTLTPEEAAALAAQVLGHDDLFSVEVTDLNGETVFMVTFSSGDLVYVSMDGQIRSIGKVQVETVVVKSRGGGGGGGGNASVDAPAPSQPQESHEEHDDHQEHESHDD